MPSDEGSKRGRPLTLTPEIRDLICQAIREGNFREVAARWVGVPARTFHRWCARGKAEESGPYWDLWQAVQEAECAAEIKMVELVFRAATQDPRHAQWWLERKCPQRWATNRGELRALAKQIAQVAGVSGAKPDASSRGAAEKLAGGDRDTVK